MFEKFFLSWLMAITVEYLLLPGPCRSLDRLEAVSQMSGGRTAIVFFLSFLTLCFFSRRLIKSKEKSLYHRGILLIFTLLAATSLQASFSPAFFAVCCLLFLRLFSDCKRPLSYTALTDRFSKRTWKSPAEGAAGVPEQTLQKRNKKTGRLFLWATVLLSLLFFLFVSVWTVSRVYCFSTPTYDFGIFSQMFHYMKTTGLPYTTLERDGLLSHFHVHISPIYYLLLPFYCLSPVPATLQILQAVVITSALIPLWKLGRHYGLAPFQRMLLCTLLLLYPAFSGGVGYDIHENCFLTPLLLWLFYGIARRNSRLTAAAALLTMLVKEDAPVYVACTSLWLLADSLSRYSRNNYDPKRHDKYGQNREAHKLPRRIDRYTAPSDRWDMIAGGIMLSASLAYFFAVTNYLSVYGNGLMTARYDNFIIETASPFTSLIKTIFLCPMKVVYECADPDKLWFIAVTILPLLGLPFLTRRWERYLLLIPYVLINLMPDYAYQHNVFFQYVFGSAACLVYLTVLNLADLRQKVKEPYTAALISSIPTDPSSTAGTLISSSATAETLSVSSTATVILTAAVAVCAVCFVTTIVPRAVSYPSRYVYNRDDYQELRHTLSRIPDEASVTASTFYSTFLSQRDILYDIHYASREHLLSTEFVVLDPASENDLKRYAGDGKTGYEGVIELLNKNDYQLYIKIRGTVEIYRRSQLSLPDNLNQYNPFTQNE